MPGLAQIREEAERKVRTENEPVPIKREFPGYSSRTPYLRSTSAGIHPCVPHQILTSAKREKASSMKTVKLKRKKGSNKLRMNPDRFVRSNGRRGFGVEVADDAPYLYWIPGQSAFTKKQRKFLYEQALTLASIGSMATAMSMEMDTLRNALAREPKVANKIQRLQELTLYALRGQVVEKALKGDVMLMLRVLGSRNIFNEKVVQENFNVNTKTKKFGRNYKNMSADELRDIYKDMLKDG